MALVKYSIIAREDLENIWDYLGEDSPSRADNLLRKIKETVELLSENPLIGKSRKELRPGLRSFPIGNYLIFYLPVEDGIKIIRVFHGARDIPKLFN